jgi:four helix bundle protein
LFEEGGQVRRSSKSIASMIVEGYGRRRYKADFIKYLVYSHAECDETIVHIDFLFETRSLKEEALYKTLKMDYEVLSKKINNYIRWVEDHWNGFSHS